MPDSVVDRLVDSINGHDLAALTACFESDFEGSVVDRASG